MKKIRFLFLNSFLILFLLTGCSMKNTSKENVETFAAYTEIELYHSVPVLLKEHTKIGVAEDYGEENYVLDVQGTTKKDYEEYLVTLEEAGFQKHSDNGKEGMEGHVYSTMFTKDNLTLGVVYVTRLERVMITASRDLALSEHLNYKDEYTKNNVSGAKTKIYFPKLAINNGFSAIIQLKNGHFVVHDGGGAKDGKELVAYLQKLAPNGEKPVVEGWFLSHTHTDHVGALQEIAINKALSESICVEEIFYFHPGKEFSEHEEYAKIKLMNYALKTFKNTKGESTAIYRPQFGQRYYFNDLVMDIAMTMEVEPYDSYEKVTYNDSSVYMMHYIEGQKYFTTGDGDNATMQTVMKVFPESYLEMDIYMVSHHGINVYNYFTDYCTIDTAIYTRNELGSPAAVEENAYFLTTVKEAYGRMDGDIVLTFPYTVGSAEIILK